MDEVDHQARPAGLVKRSQAVSVIAVEVFVNSRWSRKCVTFRHLSSPPKAGWLPYHPTEARSQATPAARGSVATQDSRMLRKACQSSVFALAPTPAIEPTEM